MKKKIRIFSDIPQKVLKPHDYPVLSIRIDKKCKSKISLLKTRGVDVPKMLREIVYSAVNQAHEESLK